MAASRKKRIKHLINIWTATIKSGPTTPSSCAPYNESLALEETHLPSDGKARELLHASYMAKLKMGPALSEEETHELHEALAKTMAAKQQKTLLRAVENLAQRLNDKILSETLSDRISDIASGAIVAEGLNGKQDK